MGSLATEAADATGRLYRKYSNELYYRRKRFSMFGENPVRINQYEMATTIHCPKWVKCIANFLRHRA